MILFDTTFVIRDGDGISKSGQLERVFQKTAGCSIEMQVIEIGLGSLTLYGYAVMYGTGPGAGSESRERHPS